MDTLPYQVFPNKLAHPYLRAQALLRPQLNQRLNEGLQKRMILVSAPAGFGKTTLVNMWLDHQKLPAVWLCLDREDNHPARFFFYLISALAKGNPDLADTNEQLLYYQDALNIETVLSNIVQDFMRRPSGMILVLDDYHVIRNPLIHKAVQYLIQSQVLEPGGAGEPRKGILPVIISRGNPPFPLIRWRIQNELAELNMQDLRFSENEVRNFFFQTVGSPLSESQARRLNEKAEGWIAGLLLASISFHEHQNLSIDQQIQTFNGGNHLVADYWMNEVISSLPETLRQFLLDTSILKRFCGPLCDAVRSVTDGGVDGANGGAKCGDSQQILEELEQRNLFVVNLDPNRGWYRYHHLLAEFLENHPSSLSAQRRQQMNLAAAHWLEANGDLAESMRHYLAAQQPEEAVRVLAEAASPILNHGQILQLGGLISLFPDQAFDRWPWLSIYRAWKEVILEPGNETLWLEKAEKGIQQAEAQHAPGQAERSEMLGNIYAIRVLSAARKGSLKDSFALGKQALALLPPEVTKVRGLVMFSEGMSQFVCGDLKGAETSFLRAKSELLQGGNIGGTAEVLGPLGELELIQGRLHAAEAIFQQAAALLPDPEQEFFASYQSYARLGELYFEWNRLPEAFSNLERSNRYSAKMGLSAQVCTGSALADAYLRLGDLKKAKEILETMRYSANARQVKLPFESNWAACWIRFYALSGDFREAEWLIGDRKIGQNQSLELVWEVEAMAQAEFYWLKQDYAAALRVSGRLIEQMRAGGRVGRLIRMLILQAAVYASMGREDPASACLSEALDRARLEGYLRSFIDFGQPVLKLLSDYVQKGSGLAFSPENQAYCVEILHASLIRDVDRLTPVEKSPRKRSPIPVIDNPLTAQETSILKLLVAGYDNYEISVHDQISINTVKTHISHIFSKLGVHNRCQATARARLLGLV
jgi:LuxR family maltose regulon positive regulatory protein